MSPEAQALFNSRFGLGNDFVNAFPGGIKYFADTGAYSMTPETSGVRTGVLNWLGDYGNSIQKNPFVYSTDTGFSNSPILNDLFKDYGNVIDQTRTSMGPAPTVQAGQSSPGVASAMSPDAAQAAARGILRDIAGPGITSALSSMGMGRSGAEAEAISKRGLEMSLPIAQQAEQEALAASIANANNATSSSISNAGLQTSANSTSAQLAARQQEVIAQIVAALQGKKLDAGLQLGMAKPAYDLSLGQLMPTLAKLGIDAGQLPNTLLQQKQGTDSQMLLSLLGLPNPTGGTTTGVQNTNSETSQDSSVGIGGILSQAAILTAILGPKTVQDALKGGYGVFKELWDKTIGSDPATGLPNFGLGPDAGTAPFDPGIDINPNIGDLPSPVEEFDVSPWGDLLS